MGRGRQGNAAGRPNLSAWRSEASTEKTAVALLGIITTNKADFHFFAFHTEVAVQPRQLTFPDFADVRAEVDRLHADGYEKLGQWDLAQVCDHLTYFVQGSLDGFTFRVPWLLKVLLGRLVLWRILKQGRMKAGVYTPQKPLPAAGGDETAAVARFKQVLERFQAHQGQLHDSPFFGHLTPRQWQDLHLIHCGHHLGYLLPKSAAGL